jgi:hypothetical protein
VVNELLFLGVEVVHLLLGKFKVIFVTFSYLEVFMANFNAFFEKVLDLASSQDVMGLALSDN